MVGRGRQPTPRALLSVRHLAVSVLLGLALGFDLGPAWAVQDGAVSKTPSLRTIFGFSEQAFGKMDFHDIRAATRTWAEIILRQETGHLAQAESYVYPALPDMEKDLSAKRLDMVALLPQEYLDLKSRTAIDPILLAEPPRAPLARYVILVRKERGLRTFADLGNLRLAIEASGRGALPWLWLESTLKKAALPKASTFFFASSKEDYRGSQAVLAVFFKNADVCVAAQHSFETMAVLNPQVGNQLTVLATSPGFAHGVVVVRPDIDQELRDAMYRRLLKLHTHATGRQVLTLFRAGRMIPFGPGQLKTVEKLLRESRQQEAQGNG